MYTESGEGATEYLKEPKKSGKLRPNCYMFVRPLTLEECGKPKCDFIWLDKTIGDLESEE